MIPGWAFAYFDRVAERLKRTKPAEPKEIARAFDARAFEMSPIGGGPAASSRAVKASNRLKAAQTVWALKEKDPTIADKDIFAEIGDQLGRSARYVEEAYYEFSHKTR